MIVKIFERNWIPTLATLVFWTVFCSSAASQILIPVQDQSLVDPQVQVDVQYDASTDLYTYS